MTSRCFNGRYFTLDVYVATLLFHFSDNFLILEIFFGKLMTEEVIQMTSYDGFAFFCKIFRHLSSTIF